MGFFALNRRNSNRDPMRESAALTTVYLLEWNRKFEQFLRAKVGELEARVAAQQSRLSMRVESEAREIWADELPLLDDFEDEFILPEPAPPPDDLEDGPVEVEAAPPVIATTADYLSLLGANPANPTPAADEWAEVELSQTDETTAELLPDGEGLEVTKVDEFSGRELPEEEKHDAWLTDLPDAAPEDDTWAESD